MTKEQARQHALGYAAGREDGSGIRTSDVVGDSQLRSGWVAFADAFATAQDDYNNGRRVMMTNDRDAYECWQKSGGATIFSPYER